jgi:hypothetical protein
VSTERLGKSPQKVQRMRPRRSSLTRRGARLVALVALSVLPLGAAPVLGAASAEASVPCLPGSPGCPVKPPPHCGDNSTELPSTLAEPVRLIDGATVQTTVAATTRLSSHGDLCLPVVLLSYHATAPAQVGSSAHDLQLSVSVDLHQGLTSRRTRSITVTVPAGGTVEAHDQSFGLAESFTPTDLLIIRAG